MIEILTGQGPDAPMISSKEEDFADIYAAMDDIEELIAQGDRKDYNREKSDHAKEVAAKKSFAIEWQHLRRKVYKTSPAEKSEVEIKDL